MNTQSTMPMPCTICGTILQVSADAEAVYCTMCGNRIELGVHSYRSEAMTLPKIFCIDCERSLDPASRDLIYSCFSCGKTICNNCAKLDGIKRFCSKCFKASVKIKPKPKRKQSSKTKAKPKAKLKAKPKTKRKRK